MLKNLKIALVCVFISLAYPQSYSASNTHFNKTDNLEALALSSSIADWLNLELYTAINIINDYLESVNSDKKFTFIPIEKSENSQNIIYYSLKISNDELTIELKKNSKGITNESFPINLLEIVEYLDLQKNVRFELRELLYITLLDDQDYLKFFSYKNEIESLLDENNFKIVFDTIQKEFVLNDGLFEVSDFLGTNNSSYFIKKIDNGSIKLNHDSIFVDSDVAEKVNVQIGYFFKTQDKYQEIFVQNLVVNIIDEIPKAYNVNFFNSKNLKEYVILLNGIDDKEISEYIIVDYPKSGSLYSLGEKDSKKYVYEPYEFFRQSISEEKTIIIEDSFSYNVKDSKGQINRSPGIVKIKINFINPNYRPDGKKIARSYSSKDTRKDKNQYREKSSKNDGINLVQIIGGLLLVVILLAAAGGGGDDSSGGSSGGSGGIGIGIDLP